MDKKLIIKLYLNFNDELSKDLLSSKEYKKCIKNIVEQTTLLEQRLDNDSLQIFNSLINNQDMLLALESQNAFINGYTLAKKL